MKINWTEIIKTFAWLFFCVWAIGELSSQIKQPDPVTIDFNVSDSTNKVIKEKDSLLALSIKTIDILKQKRNEIPKKVSVYSDSDLIRFTDSFSAVYGVNGRITIQAAHR